MATQTGVTIHKRNDIKLVKRKDKGLQNGLSGL